MYTGALVSLLGGGALVWLSHILRFGYGRGVALLIGVALLLTALYCIAGIIYLWKENNTAMYISDEGIIDISTGNSIGTVLWKDVESIKIMDDISNLKRKYLVIKVSNPLEYIARETNRSKRRSMELRLQYYGSPICFSNRAIDCTFEELKDAVFLKYNAYKQGLEEAQV